MSFYETLKGQVIDEVYNLWKDKGLVLDLATDPVDPQRELRHFHPTIFY